MRIQSVLEFLLLVLTLLEGESSDFAEETAVGFVEDLEFVLAACELGFSDESVEDGFLGYELVEFGSETGDFRRELEVSRSGELDLFLHVLVLRGSCSDVGGMLSEFIAVVRIVEHSTTRSEFWIRRRGGWFRRRGGGGRGVGASSTDPM